jgi:hypothetical protein
LCRGTHRSEKGIPTGKLTELLIWVAETQPVPVLCHRSLLWDVYLTIAAAFGISGAMQGFFLEPSNPQTLKP